MKNMHFKRKLPVPKEIKEQYPLTAELSRIKNERDAIIADVFTGASEKKVLIIGPCSADREDAVLDYCGRLARLQEKVADKLILIPRVYTNKPRTTGEGYKGLLHQPNPEKDADMLEGVIAIRRLHTNVLAETGLSTADEMLYPDNYRYLSDLLAYVAVGARSVENQEHRLTASGIAVPVGMKNPTSGDISVMLNSILAAQRQHTFIYRGWEVETTGNELAHAILRGYVNRHGEAIPNYHFEEMEHLYNAYEAKGLDNISLIVDANHSNSAKKYWEQPRICKEVLHSCRHSDNIRSMVKGFMIESYLEEGSQKIGEGVYGKSITDPCIGWTATERLVQDIAELVCGIRIFEVENILTGTTPGTAMPSRANLCQSSNNWVLNYRSPVSGRMVTTVLPAPSSLAMRRATVTLDPLEIPQRIPSSCMSRRVVSMASSSVTMDTSSKMVRSRLLGMRPSPMPICRWEPTWPRERTAAFWGSAAQIFMWGKCSFSAAPTPERVPPVPTPEQKP